MLPAFQKLTHSTPLESDQMRRAPWFGIGGSITRAAPLLVSISAM